MSLRLQAWQPSFSQAAQKVLAGEGQWTGLYGSALSWAIQALHENDDNPTLVVVSHSEAAGRLADDLATLDCEARLARDDHKEQDESSEAFWAFPFFARSHQLLILTPEQAMQPVDRQMAGSESLELSCGLSCDPDDLWQDLISRSFQVQAVVSAPGHVARRGSVIDIGPSENTQGLRLEFFGDALESIRLFDPATQLTVEKKEHFQLALPGKKENREVPLYQILKSTSKVILADLTDDDQSQDLMTTLSSPSSPFSQKDRPWIELSGPPGRHDHVRTGTVEKFQSDLKNRDHLIAHHLHQGEDVLMAFNAQAEQDRFVERMQAMTVPTQRLTGILGSFHEAFALPDMKLVVLNHHHRRHRRSMRAQWKRVVADPLDLAALKPGDLVTHVMHGLGRFQAVTSFEREGVATEYLELLFAGNARVYVPSTEMDRVARYVGTGSDTPSLSDLSRKNFQRLRKKAEASAQKWAEELLTVQAFRQEQAGMTFPPVPDDEELFAAAFPFEETPDQLFALQEIYKDMEKDQAMDRLLCGDVGFGKTEIAMRAAWRCVLSGRQVAVLTPTTVLCQQHLSTFSDRFQDTGASIDSINRFRSPKTIQQILEQCAQGHLDILIGTHRLLSEDVSFNDLGLVIIDEEHRFGVKHKERLKQLRKNVDVLALSATPIPRTLNMALMGLKDISSLLTPPTNRLPVKTRVVSYDDDLMRQAIQQEVQRGGQVLFLHNRVKTIDVMAREVQALIPSVKVAIGHGQMEEDKLQKVMVDFVRGRFDVLVCSTIVESGLDISTANTIIINDADRFGLSQLHQLRGRVGRTHEQAYCYLVKASRREVGRKGLKRMLTLEEFSALGAGFEIAMQDMELRGAGQLVGLSQSGHVQAVGYEIYLMMLKQAVARLQNTAPPVPPDVVIDVPIAAGLPESYIPDHRRRMAAYRKLAAAEHRQALDQVVVELKDMCGPLPASGQRLLLLHQLRHEGAAWGIQRIDWDQEKGLRLTMNSPEVNMAPLLSAFDGQVLLNSPTSLFLKAKARHKKPYQQLEALFSLCERLKK